MREQRSQSNSKFGSSELDSRYKSSKKTDLADISPTGSSLKSTDKETISDRDFGLIQSIVAVCLVSLAVYIAGFLLTTVSAQIYDFKSKPNDGDVLYSRTSKEPITFRAYYPQLRKFAITNNGWESGTESQFSRQGILLTGLFFHTVLNAFHWTLEMKLSNLRLMVFIPFILFLLANFVLFFKLIPPSKRTQANVTTYSLAVGLSHAFLVLIVYIVFSFVFPDFGALFGHPFLYSGAQMPIMLPSILVIVLTGFTYGAICGGIIAGLLFIKTVLSEL